MKEHSTLLLGSVSIVLVLSCSQIMLSQQPSKDAELDRMIDAGKSKHQLAQYVFNTHGCKSCHTIGRDGKLGFTSKGQERAKGFEGCINMLTAMTVIVQVPDDKRSSEQRQKIERFTEFGCTSCHQVTPGKLGLTEVGAKLQHLHLGCVDVEKVVASSISPQH
jgi:cytochrome c551/c552